MRSVLSVSLTGLFLLALVSVGLNLSNASSQYSSAKPVAILVGSHGYMLPIATLPGSLDRFDDAIAVGDLLLAHPSMETGLRVAVLLPGLEFKTFQIIRTATDPQASERLTDLIDTLPYGSVVIASVRGMVRPPQEALAALDEFPLTLGAELTPFRASAASWAVISCKLESGWRTVAESYSEDQGVHLAFTLSPNTSIYSDYRSDVFYSRGSGRQTVELYPSIKDASFETEDSGSNRWATAGGVRKASITQRPTQGTPSVIRWEQTMVGPNFAYSVHFSLHKATESKLATPEFTLLLDGEIVGSYVPEPSLEPAWRNWTLELNNTEQRIVDIELRAELIGEGSAATYNLGAPSISWGTAN